MLFIVIYILCGCYLHYGWLKSDRANEVLNQCSLGYKILFTVYSIFASPAIVTIGVFKEINERRKR